MNTYADKTSTNKHLLHVSIVSGHTNKVWLHVNTESTHLRKSLDCTWEHGISVKVITPVISKWPPAAVYSPKSRTGSLFKTTISSLKTLDATVSFLQAPEQFQRGLSRWGSKHQPTNKRTFEAAHFSSCYHGMKTRMTKLTTTITTTTTTTTTKLNFLNPTQR